VKSEEWWLAGCVREVAADDVQSFFASSASDGDPWAAASASH